MTDPAEPPAPQRADAIWPPWVEQWVMPFLQESAMWPLLVALMGHVVVVLALAVLEAARAQTPLGWVGLVVLVMLSLPPPLHEVRHRRRPGAVTWTVISAWVLAGAVAWVAAVTGVL